MMGRWPLIITYVLKASNMFIEAKTQSDLKGKNSKFEVCLDWLKGTMFQPLKVVKPETWINFKECWEIQWPMDQFPRLKYKNKKMISKAFDGIFTMMVILMKWLGKIHRSLDQKRKT